jgi:maltooligosyltrehalose trehalohydrolase
VGAEVVEGGVHFRVWAAARREVEVLVPGRPPVRLDAGADGYFAGLAPGLAAGARYQLRLDGEHVRPDPASRFQPEGPDGPSEVVDPGSFRWTDAGWRGLRREGQVLYELHVGTFTREGTWAAAARRLAHLAELGVTAVEVMPVAEFPGRFGWGYDGVDLFAPSHLYGRPDELRDFVDRAHTVGLGVILDVVYNHLGPDGNYLRDFSPSYFTDRHATEWGDPFDVDGPGSAPVREFLVENAVAWVSEYHVDGLRFDATQAMFDGSPVHVLREIQERVRAAAGDRGVLLVAENEPQRTHLVRPAGQAGLGLDACWNDDFHHSARVALTGRREAYYTDYRGTPQELVSLAKRGYLFQGQRYAWQRKGRGTPALDLPGAAFVCYLENHDQVANSAAGARLRTLTGAGRWRAMTAFLLLGPWTPMLFQGQEAGSSRPFLYFADHRRELAPVVRAGRAAFVRQFPSIADPDLRDRLDDPGDLRTFERCRLDRDDFRPELFALHRDLLEVRRTDPVIRGQGAGGLDGAVIGPDALALRWFGGAAGDRLLLLNLGADVAQPSLAEPLVAPPEGTAWAVAWSSEHPRYGGTGTEHPFGRDGVRVTGHAAVLLAPDEARRA